MNEIVKLKEIIDTSNKIVFFTGAGISVPSGIPDFRSNNGLYKQNLNAEKIISHSYFVSSPKNFYAFYKEKMCYPDALTNIAHKWIAKLEKDQKSLGVITQNIDNLHTLAGSKNVIELHGSIYRNYCTKCHKAYGLDYILNSDEIPMCDCGGIIKPDVVLYEEPLDEKVIYKAIDTISKADTLIIIGTSLSVYPAASYIDFFRGDNLVIINKGEVNKNNATLVINDDIINVVNKFYVE